MRHLLTIGALLAPVACAWAEEPKPKLQRIAEFAPVPLCPGNHDCVRAGTCKGMSKHAIPAINSHYGFGYIGGSSLRGGPRSTYDTLNVACNGGSYGTFGSDYVLFGRRPGRVFLGFLDKPRAKSYSDKYQTDKAELPDPIAAQPFKKAVREAILEHRGEGHGGEGHGEKAGGEKAGGEKAGGGH